MDLEKAQAYLMQAGPEGASLEDHLVKLMARLLDEQPADGVGRFEELSRQVKGETLKNADTIKVSRMVFEGVSLAFVSLGSQAFCVAHSFTHLMVAGIGRDKGRPCSAPE